MTRVLVTGAAGFVGTRLVDRLVSGTDASVRAGLRRYGGAANVARFPVEFVLLGLEPSQLRAAVADCDVVIHCAHDWADPAMNAGLADGLIDAMAREGVRRIVYLSSLAAYFPTHRECLDETTPLDESGWSYALEKRELTDRILTRAASAGVEATVLELACVYGPFSIPFATVPAQQLAAGRVVLPPADEGTCNLVYIDDAVDAMIAAMDRPGAVGERILVTGPTTVSWGDFYRGLGVPDSSERIIEMGAAEVDDLLHTSGAAGTVKLVRQDPRRVLTSELLTPIRSLARRAVPSRTWERVRSSGPLPLLLPDEGARIFRWSTAAASGAKARDVLGTAPSIEPGVGLAKTASYLRWASGLEP